MFSVRYVSSGGLLVGDMSNYQAPRLNQHMRSLLVAEKKRPSESSGNGYMAEFLFSFRKPFFRLLGNLLFEFIYFILEFLFH